MPVPRIAERALDAGFREHLPKPVNPNVLLQTLEDLLANAYTPPPNYARPPIDKKTDWTPINQCLIGMKNRWLSKSVQMGRWSPTPVMKSNSHSN